MQKHKTGWMLIVMVTAIMTFGLPEAPEAGVNPQNKSAVQFQRAALPVAEAFGNTVLKFGATGKDVIELQGRMKFLGYHKGSIDGQFGWGTFASLKKFQTAFGMPANGIADAKVKLRLWSATKNYRPGNEEATALKRLNGEQEESTPVRNANELSAADLKMLQRVVYGEARGEPYEGQVAVAAVVLNRINDPLFPDTVSGVVFQPGAFTAVADGQIWLDPDDRAKQAVLDALSGWDPSGEALYYFNPRTATSKWIWTRPQIKQIGEHIFTK